MISQGKVSYQIDNNLPLIGRQETLWTKLADVVRATRSALEVSKQYKAQIESLNRIKE